MDTIIFLLVFATLLAMFNSSKKVVLSTFVLTLILTVLLFNHHVTDKLPLNF